MPKRSETIQNHKKLQQQEVNLVKWLWKKNMIRGKQANSVRQYLTRLPFSICSILGTYTCVLGRLVRASKKKVYSKYIRIYDIYISHLELLVMYHNSYNFTKLKKTFPNSQTHCHLPKGTKGIPLGQPYGQGEWVCESFIAWALGDIGEIFGQLNPKGMWYALAIDMFRFCRRIRQLDAILAIPILHSFPRI